MLSVQGERTSENVKSSLRAHTRVAWERRKSVASVWAPAARCAARVCAETCCQVIYYYWCSTVEEHTCEIKIKTIRVNKIHFTVIVDPLTVRRTVSYPRFCRVWRQNSPGRAMGRFRHPFRIPGTATRTDELSKRDSGIPRGFVQCPGSSGTTGGGGGGVSATALSRANNSQRRELISYT